jgi:hypothetical protein
MTNLNDPNGDHFRARRQAEETSYTGWIVGGVIALAVVIGIFALSSRGTDQNTAAHPPITATTTGSAVPAPKTPAVPTMDTAKPVTPAPNTTAPAR